MKLCGIYRITNKINNKNYVGSSVNLNERRSMHYRLLRIGKSHSSKLQNAFNKYGENSFVFEILETCDCAELEQKEIEWIIKLNAVKNGYNTSIDVRCPTRGFKHSVESRLKMSESQKSRVRSDWEIDSSRKRLVEFNQSQKGVAKTEQHRERISEANKGRKQTLETRQKMSDYRKKNPVNFWLGKSRNESDKLKMSESHKGKTGEKHPRSKRIAQINLKGEVLQTFVGISEAARQLNIKRKSISNCLCGLSKTAGGFIWRYEA